MKAEPRNNLVLVGGVEPPLAVLHWSAEKTGAGKGSAAEVWRVVVEQDRAGRATVPF